MCAHNATARVVYLVCRVLVTMLLCSLLLTLSLLTHHLVLATHRCQVASAQNGCCFAYHYCSAAFKYRVATKPFIFQCTMSTEKVQDKMKWIIKMYSCSCYAVVKYSLYISSAVLFLGDRLQNGSPYAIGPLSVCCVCLSVCLSLTLVYCGQMVGWIKMKLRRNLACR